MNLILIFSNYFRRKASRTEDDCLSAKRKRPNQRNSQDTSVGSESNERNSQDTYVGSESTGSNLQNTSGTSGSIDIDSSVNQSFSSTSAMMTSSSPNVLDRYCNTNDGFSGAGAGFDTFMPASLSRSTPLVTSVNDSSAALDMDEETRQLIQYTQL